jgi:hypothetical protein
MEIEPDGQPYRAFVSPNKRYVVYTTLKTAWKTRHWGNPVGSAGLNTGEHLITEISVELFSVLWSKNSTAFTVQTITQYSAYIVYYVRNFGTSLSRLTYRNCSNGLTFGERVLPVYEVDDIASDGNQVLFEAGNLLLFWDVRNPSENRILTDSVIRRAAIFSPQAASEVMYWDRDGFTKYDLTTSRESSFGSRIKRASQVIGNTQEAVISPNGKWVALLRNVPTGQKVSVYIIDTP